MDGALNQESQAWILGLTVPLIRCILLGNFIYNSLYFLIYAAAKSLQSYPTLCDPIDGSPPGCPIPGILHARSLEWVAISFSSAWKWKVQMKSLSRVRLLVSDS